MKYLLMIDRKFPFEKGETFIENEINEISRHFDRIIIYPINISKKEEKTREITPKNVDVKVLSKFRYKYMRIIYFVNSIFYLFKYDFRDAYIHSIGKMYSNKIIKSLKQYNLSERDEIFIYSYWFYSTASIAIYLKERLMKKNINSIVLSRAHGFDIYEYNHYLPCRKIFFEKIDKVVCISKDGMNYLKEKYKDYSNKVTYSYLGTLDHGITPQKNNKEFVIVSCSRIVPLKRIELIIESLSHINKKKLNKKIIWYHIGDGDKLEELKKMAKNKLLDINYNFLGYLKNSEVYDFYRNNSVDLFLNVSSTEGLPVSIMEAISFGIPSIATDVGGTREIVINNITGELIDKNFEVKTLSKLIEKYASMNDEEIKELKEKTRYFWQENFNAKDNYEKFAKKILSIGAGVNEIE